MLVLFTKASGQYLWEIECDKILGMMTAFVGAILRDNSGSRVL